MKGQKFLTLTFCTKCPLKAFCNDANLTWRGEKNRKKQSQNSIERPESDDYLVFCQRWVSSRVEGMRASCWAFRELSTRFYSNRHTLIFSYPHAWPSAVKRTQPYPVTCWPPLVHLLSCLLSKGGTPELPADVAKETARTKVGSELESLGIHLSGVHAIWLVWGMLESLLCSFLLTTEDIMSFIGKGRYRR